MGLTENGLIVHFAEKRAGEYKSLVDFDGIRRFLHESISVVQKNDPVYWYLLEVGNRPLFVDPDPETAYEVWEASLILDDVSGILFAGDAFSKYWTLYVGDCSGVISLNQPFSRDPQEILSLYNGRTVESIVAEMKEDDIYFYCYEWLHMAFFGFDQTLALIKNLARSRSLPVSESVAFEDR